MVVIEIKTIEGVQVKKETEYPIEDVAQMMGPGRDVLRFYRKKGVINARKGDNGYRYYSEEDIYGLIYTLYQRKMDISPEEIEEFMSGRRSMKSRGSYLRERMAEEKCSVRMHQQIITRLKLVEEDIACIEECLGWYSLRKFPSAYIMGNRENLQEGLKGWFRLSSTAVGLDMTYFYNMLTYTDRGLAAQGTRLLFYKRLELDLGEGFNAGRYPMAEEKLCLCTVLESGAPLPSSEMIQRMVQRGHRYGIETKGLVYANDMTSFLAKEGAVYHLKVYMPAGRALSQIQMIMW